VQSNWELQRGRAEKRSPDWGQRKKALLNGQVPFRDYGKRVAGSKMIVLPAFKGT